VLKEGPLNSLQKKMATSKAIGDGVTLWTEKSTSPPATYKYQIESTGFNKVVFTFDFTGSQNFRIVNTPVFKDNHLKAQVIANPYGKSNEVVLQQVDVTKGGSMSMGMSWSRQDPDPEVLAAHKAEFDQKMSEVIANAETTFPVSLQETPVNSPQDNFTAILEACSSAGTSYIDVVFPPNDISLYKTDNTTEGQMAGKTNAKVITWRRPAEFLKDYATNKPDVFVGAIEPADIKQGALGDCWFMCSLASLAEFPSLIQNLFVTDRSNEEGAYQLKFCKNGQWTVVTVDDYFPCKPEDGPVYSKANGSELWVLLIEKAFAKLHGSYASIRGGFAYEAMMDLTGAPYRCMKFSDPDVKEMTDSGKLWELMNYWDDNDYLMSVSTPGEDHQTETAHRPGSGTGLVAGHAYSLMDAQLMPGGEKLVQVRNPW